MKFFRKKEEYSPNLIMNLLISARPHQWLKNLVVFCPALFNQSLFTWESFKNSSIATFLFILISSSVYLFNDLVDIEKDRLHPDKKHRPLAAGIISPVQGAVCGLILGLISLVISSQINLKLGLIILTYFACNLLYSKKLKKIVIIDSFSISFFFILRLYAGSVINKIELSPWIIVCTGLLALFIAFGKRFAELESLQREAPKHRPVLAKYDTNFLLQTLNISTALTLSLYTLYSIEKGRMIITLPFVFYGILRYYYQIVYLHQGSDPIYAIFTDRKMKINLIFWIITTIISLYY